MSCSSQWVLQSVAVTVMLILPTSSRRWAKWRRTSIALPSSQRNRPFLSALAVRSSDDCANSGRILNVAVCSNPEFLREGSAIRDFTHPDRVLIGCDHLRGREVMERLYHPLALRNAPILFVSPESAELAKYAANAFLAMKICFINEIADLSEAVEADVQEVATAIGADGRIGSKFLHAGPGYGGSCFPKDVTALIRTAREAKTPLSLVEQVEKVNAERKIAMAGRIEAAVGGSLRNKIVAVLGVTFKPNTDDMREAPSLVILPMLQARGARIRVYDPQGRPRRTPYFPTWSGASALEAARVLM